ncbi:hypothetical protein A3K42_01620 [candidate division WWE3 bacterium RBG_13_37_7]|uniref:Glycoside hydrolase family 57 N-terminal domain-containing protein n=1 Tax=candidate division WWE3 bacterium RBG_13_37_7 TaxID=1802609 RepID=A0A1F4U2A6_UNCKA|nr:MAG: hypothetical protein A3K42_01620 [candidate division WWE3 bacterium RBG_13_37_7]
MLNILLHFYQPAEQQPDILGQIVHQSYKPLFEGLSALNKSCATINISGSLLDLLDKYRYFGLIDTLRTLKDRNIVEFTGSSKYHALLPLIPEKEVTRQIKLNTDTLHFYLGKDLQLKGFFPPEMGYSSGLIPLIKSEGFSWIILDELAFDGGRTFPIPNRVYVDRTTKTPVFFRNRRLSNLIMSGLIRDTQSLITTTKHDQYDETSCFIAAMDGETFGHHRPGLDSMLLSTLKSDVLKFITLSELLKTKGIKRSFISNLYSCTWASSPKDIKLNTQFLSWNNPKNIIHTYQWSLLELVLAQVSALSKQVPSYKKIREKMDIALASDHFWWASANPWWSVEMIEDGSNRLLSIINSTPNISDKTKSRAQLLYTKIISTAFEWQRTGKIRSMFTDSASAARIPFRERTLEKGGIEKGIYEAFIFMLKNLEKEAAKEGNYEKAILWRDALIKIETKNDIYDAIHAVDLLRQEIPYVEVEKMLDKYTEEYKNIRGGQPEQRDLNV